MNSHLHHTVVLARLADFRYTAERERAAHRAPPEPERRRAPRVAALRRRILRPAA